jgi:hypothetical protein
MLAIVSILLFLCVGIPLAFYNGVIVADAWNWFIKDPFGLPALSSLQGWGMMLFISSTTIFREVQRVLAQKKENEPDFEEALGKTLLLFITFFITALFVHGYMWAIHTLFW